MIAVVQVTEKEPSYKSAQSAGKAVDTRQLRFHESSQQILNESNIK